MIADVTERTVGFINKLNNDIRSQFPYIESVNLDTDYTSFSDVPLQRAIMLDRYSLKDFTLETLAEGDLVVVTIKDDKKFPQRGYGYITEIEKDHVSIKVDAFYGGDVIRRPKTMIDKPLEIFLEQIARRVARGVAEAEKELFGHWKQEFSEQIGIKDFVPAGRIWFGAGNIAKVTWLNCFVIPSPRDSRRGIAEHAAEHMDIMATGGGVGSNMSTLRPRKARVTTVNGHSSGMVSWTNYIATLTHLIQQGGSRRGAQMKCLNDTHPEAILFAMCKIQNPDRLRAIAKRFAKFPDIAETALSLIDPKDPTRVIDPDFMTGANISICVSHDFMDAVDKGQDWTFKFPDIENYTPEEKKFYDEEWHLTGGDIREWTKKISPTTGKPFTLRSYETLPARVLYDLFMYCAWASAEPGFLFYDNARDMANSAYYAQVIATNPCAEQWLPAYATCNLGAVNFANMYDPDNDDVDWARLKKSIHTGVRFLDDVLDVTHYPLKEIEAMCKGERRIGLGFMGLADLFIQLKLGYGSKKMLKKLAQLMEFFRNESYQASINIAKEKGSFSFFDADQYLEMGFVKTLPEFLREQIREFGIRNVCINTVAPTGTTGSMIGVGTGLEPYYGFEYFRSGRMGEFVPVKVQIAQDWLDANGKTDIQDLPDYFVSAQDLTVYEHVNVQAVVQQFIDSATSKTCNAPNSMTVEETAKFYKDAYELGLKGVTIYRDGSRFEAVLTTKAEITKDVNDADDVFLAEGAEVAYLGELPAQTGDPLFDETALDSTKVCTIRYENGQRIVECGTE